MCVIHLIEKNIFLNIINDLKIHTPFKNKRRPPIDRSNLILIYRSIKYYYVKKFTSHDTEKTTKQRGPVNKVSKEIMDKIKTHLQEEFHKNPKFKPSETFKLFKDGDDPLLKKCYKNQYYQIKNKMYNVNV